MRHEYIPSMQVYTEGGAFPKFYRIRKCHSVPYKTYHIPHVSKQQSQLLTLQIYTWRLCLTFTYSKLNLTIADDFKGFYRGGTSTCSTGKINTFKNHLSKTLSRVYTVCTYMCILPHNQSYQLNSLKALRIQCCVGSMGELCGCA